MKFVKQLLNTYNKGLKYDGDVKALNNTITTYQETVTELKEDKDKLGIKLSKLQKDLDSLTASKNFDVNAHKDWYESRREQQNWVYNGYRLGSKDVKQYLKVSKEGEQAIKELCNQLISKYSLSTNSKAQQIPEAVMKHFMGRGAWVYKYDKKKQGVPEFWQDAYTSLKDKSGDCEDLAILMYNVIYYTYEILDLQKYQWRNTFVCASVLGEGGHGFNTFLADDGQYYVVESTFDLMGSFRKTWLKTPIINNNMYYGFWGFATKQKSWKGSNTAFKGLNEQ